VSWSADPGQGQVEYGLTDALGLSTPLTAVADAHEQAVLGLKAGHTYYWRVVHERPDGTRLVSPIETFTTGEAPAAFQPYTLYAVDPTRSEVADGFLVLSQTKGSDSIAAILDGDGELVWWMPDDGEEEQIIRARFGLDRRSIIWSSYDGDRSSDLGYIVRQSLDGRESTRTRALEHHHDFVEREDGTLAWLSWDYAPHIVDDTPMDIAADVIRFAPEGYSDPTVEYGRVFSFFDDYPQPPWLSCDHMSFDAYVPDHWEWTHSNSIAYEPSENAYYILARYLDALLKIDADTGALIWQLGGLHSDFALDDGSVLIDHGHFSHVWPGGMLLFDNANHGTRTSRVVEYAWDESDMSVSKVWEYLDPLERFTSYLGDARRLPGGNTLVLYSPKGEIHEVTPEGDLVWEAKASGTTWRVSFLDDLYGVTE